MAQWLEQESLDLLELSGGTYEQLSFFGTGEKGKKAPQLAQSTQLREAYFLDYAERTRKATKISLMVTGRYIRVRCADIPVTLTDLLNLSSRCRALNLSYRLLLECRPRPLLRSLQ